LLIGITPLLISKSFNLADGLVSLIPHLIASNSSFPGNKSHGLATVFLEMLQPIVFLSVRPASNDNSMDFPQRELRPYQVKFYYFNQQWFQKLQKFPFFVYEQQ
jgi:hypothetical protein